jgi:predicted transcriptional regulator
MSELIMRGKTVAEAAEILAVSQAAIRKNLQEARNLLKVCAPEAVEQWLAAARSKL